MMEVTIYKHHLTGNFTQTDNRIIEDTRLSCEAYKLLTWVLHCPPDKEHDFDEWQAVLHVGFGKLKKVLAELIELGYLKKTQQGRNEWGQFTKTEYQFFDSSSQEDFTVAQNPSTGSEKNTYYNNTGCNEMSVLSVPETESVENPVETVESLNDCITSSIDEATAERQELKEKVSQIPDMSAFITELTDTVKTALQRLKHPKSKKKFIKATVINQIAEYHLKPQTAPKPKKQAYGAFQNVYLTEEQHQRLINEYGGFSVNEVIEKVSEWCKNRNISGYDGLVRTFLSNAKSNVNSVTAGYFAGMDSPILQRVANFGLI